MSAGATLGLFLRSTSSKEKDSTNTSIKGMLMVQKVSWIRNEDQIGVCNPPLRKLKSVCKFPDSVIGDKI